MSYQSASNVLTATTCDLHAHSGYVAANASKGYAGKERFGVRIAESVPFLKLFYILLY